MNSDKCFFGCIIFKDQSKYLAFIDGAAEQIVCAPCARDIDKSRSCMTCLIGKFGSEEVAKYLSCLEEDIENSD